jgi:23S rRNA (cytidine1920-2'-O)/16S rRNA (cytidine1409-2'-O)-methyltransferase
MRKRLDVYLVENGYCESREKARRLIMAGQVLVNTRAQKPSYEVREMDEVLVKQPEKYISRGGYKLEKALRVFGVDLRGLCCVDVGASSGGFTDCMLQQGARKVYCVDVGYGQLHYKLRNDPRVVVMERTNARALEQKMFADELQFASVDVSFISLKLIFPALSACLTADAQVCALIKPQFEAGRGQVGKNGVVRDAAVHADTVRRVTGYAKAAALFPVAVDYSPIKGPEGNIEFLLHLLKTPAEEVSEQQIDRAVQKAHAGL